MKLAVDQVQDQQGFAGHVTAAPAAHMLSMESARDADYALQLPKQRRLPGVERAFAHYELADKRTRG